jgi:2-dehydropantoate 2-reductase
VERIAAALNGCVGVSAEMPANIDADIWSKFVMLASFSAVACLARASIGQVLASEAARTLMFEAVREAAAVARATGISLPGEIDELVMKQVRDMPREGRPSMLDDLEAGRRLELPFLSGAVARMGRAVGIATPVHDMAYRALSMHERGVAA